MVVLKISLEIEVYLLAGEKKKNFFMECQRVFCINSIFIQIFLLPELHIFLFVYTNVMIGRSVGEGFSPWYVIRRPRNICGAQPQ